MIFDINRPFKRTMTKYGRCLSCAEGVCIVHAGGQSSGAPCLCRGSQHRKACRLRASQKNSE